jgi:hypothetical protein
MTARWARTLNWLGKYDDAVRLLAPIYKAEADRRPRDPHLVVELGDAYRGQSQPRLALDLFGLALTKGEEFDPVIQEYDELWWRAQIGQGECYLAVREMVGTLHGILVFKDQGSQVKAKNLKRGERDPRVPPYLRRRLDAVILGLERAIPPKKPPLPPAPDDPAAHKGGTASSWLDWMKMAAAVGGGLILVVVLLVLKVRSQRKNRLILRSALHAKGAPAEQQPQKQPQQKQPKPQQPQQQQRS